MFCHAETIYQPETELLKSVFHAVCVKKLVRWIWRHTIRNNAVVEDLFKLMFYSAKITQLINNTMMPCYRQHQGQTEFHKLSRREKCWIKVINCVLITVQCAYYRCITFCVCVRALILLLLLLLKLLLLLYIYIYIYSAHLYVCVCVCVCIT